MNNTDMAPQGKGRGWEESGFSLVELLIYMGLLGILLTMVFSTFIPVMQSGSRQWRIGETKIETGVGLDLLRADLASAGFGLPWEFPVGVTPSPYIEPGPLADVPDVPKAVNSEDNSAAGRNNSDYLVIRGTTVTFNDSAQRWGWLGRDISHNADLQLLSDPGQQFVSTGLTPDQVLVIQPTAEGRERHRLVLNGTSYAAIPTTAALDPFAPPPTGFDPQNERYLVYGISNTAPRRPFNRTDYYISLSNANVSAHCAPGTGTLVKATLNQGDDNVTTYPIVDCVADFQVVYYLDTDGDGGADTIVNASGLNGLTAQQIREQVKSVRCYILTHEGGVDPSYTYPNANITVGEVDSNGNPAQATDGTTAGRVLAPNDMTNICPTWRNYRWKVYGLAVSPKNLN